MNYLIIGGTGFIGKNFIQSINNNEDKVFVFTTTSYKKIDNCIMVHDLDKISEDEKIDVIINLAGENIYSIWGAEKKERVYLSRIKITEDLMCLVERLKIKPKIMITASSLSYYGPSHQEEITEKSYPIKSYFYNIYNEIEQTAEKVREFGTRHCIIRLGIVLGKSGGLLKKIRWLFFGGVGLQFGSGQQNTSWVHIVDVITAIYHLIYNIKSNGAYNLCAANYLQNIEFNELLKKHFKRKYVLNFSEKIIKLLFREMGEELFLGNYKAIPKKLISEKFEFEYRKFEEAINNIK